MEFDRLFDAAEQERAQKNAKERETQEAESALRQSQMIQSMEKVSKLLLPELEKRVQELWQSEHGKFVLGLTEALIRKIKTKENLQLPLKIDHKFYSQKPERKLVLRYNNDETMAQRRTETGGETRRWETYDKEDRYLVNAENPYYCWCAKLDKYQPSDLALEADVDCGSGTISFSFGFTEKGIIKPRYGFNESKTFDINNVGLESITNLFVQSAINRSYYHPPSYEPPWHDGPN